MDPMSCLAIAGAVCQFLDFGAKLVKEALVLYEDGESTIRKKAATSTSDLQDLSAKLDHNLEQVAQCHELSADEIALQTLCRECQLLANSLAAKLKTLNVKEKHRVWKSLGTALSNVWSQKDIQKTQEDLQIYRQAIDTRIISITRNAVDALASDQSKRFNSLDAETRQIIVSLTKLKSSIESDLEVQRMALAQLLSRQDVVVKRTPDTRTVVNIYHAGPDTISAKDQVVIQACQEVQTQENAFRKAISSAILESLHFPKISQRLEEVTEAHRDTFHWILQHHPEDMQGKQWDDFVEWLETGNGLYWIGGKAGSGKSTLLKLIAHHALVKQHLSSWTGEYDLVTANFFFWSSGTTLQRSQEGMLRSLLHDILLQIPQLIPILFPKAWSDMYLQKLRLPDSTLRCSWRLSTLTEAFEGLLKQQEIEMRICLFVDGLDEYSGLDSEIAKLFHKAAAASQVKVCVSSRPHLVFKESFKSQPQLRLEDLTKGDIKNYVTDMLEKNDIMQSRLCEDEAQMKDLIDEIVQSASGVFLWVKLIVIELLKGLENHDQISLLHERLKELPTDLEELYEHMVFKVDKIYRVEASRFYQIIAATEEQEDDWRPALPLTILNLYLAEEKEDLFFSAQLGDLLPKTVLDGIRETDMRLRSRCGGLLETQFGKARDIQPEMSVTYIHRTVKDYLASTGIRHILSDRTGGLSAGSFNPNIALMRAYALHLNLLDPAESNYREACQLIDAFITHARRADWDLLEPNSDIVDTFFTSSHHWMQTAQVDENRQLLSLSTDIGTFAVRTSLYNYLRDKLNSDVVKADRRLLTQALCPISGPPGRRDMFINKEVISLLLEFGANPNERSAQVFELREDNQSPWQNAITYLATRFQYIPKKQRESLTFRWVGILKLLIQNGAKANTVCAGPVIIQRGDKVGERIEVKTVKTPREVIQTMYEKNPRELSALLKLLDSKGGQEAPVDDELDEKTKARILKDNKANGAATTHLDSVTDNPPRLAAADDLGQKIANEVRKEEAGPDVKSNKADKQLSKRAWRERLKVFSGKK